MAFAISCSLILFSPTILMSINRAYFAESRDGVTIFCCWTSLFVSCWFNTSRWCRGGKNESFSFYIYFEAQRISRPKNLWTLIDRINFRAFYLYCTLGLTAEASTTFCCWRQSDYQCAHKMDKIYYFWLFLGEF
jgi:hypothetical protein